MANAIPLVQGDQLPDVVITLTDKASAAPISLIAPGVSVKVNFRAVGDTTVKDVLNCDITDASGGVVTMHFNPTTLDTAGDYEGEIYIQYQDGRQQTVYDTLKFKVREQFQ